MLKLILSGLMISSVSVFSQGWTFDAPAATNGLTMVVGSFSSGWLSALPGLGDASGFWDMGQMGSVSTGVAVAPGTKVKLTTSVWIDGQIYPCPKMDLTGCSLDSSNAVITSSGPLGSWTTISTVWTSSQSVVNVAVFMDQLQRGFLIDAFAVEVLSAAVTIDSISAIKVTWPLGMTLQESSGTNWAASPVLFSTNNGVNQAIFQRAESAMFRAMKN